MIFLVLVIGSLVGLITVNISGYSLYSPPITLDECSEYEWKYGWGACLNIAIYEQNDRIEQKLDWNNCVLKHKTGRFYQPPNDDYKSFHPQTFDDLVKHCGEIP